MLHKRKIALLTTAAALGLGVTSASAAVTITGSTLSAQLAPNFTPSTVFTFDGPAYPAARHVANFTIFGATFAADPTASGGFIEHGSATNGYAAPTGDTTNYLALGGSTKVATNSEIVSLGKTVDQAGFYWGSIDSFNSVAFFKGNTEVGSFSGKSTGYTSLQSAYIDFGGASFNKIVFTTTRPNFEFDNLAIGSAVPEPATWAMMLLGFGGLGALLYRRSKSTALPSLAAVA